jgi:hypothetical protein
MRVNMIVTHIKPHEDELLAIWTLLRWGRGIFHGIEHAAIGLANAGLRMKGGDGYTQLVQKKTLCVGVGGGTPAPGRPIFDEHAYPREIAKDHSAATLVCEFLNLHDAALDRMLSYSLWADNNTYADPFELGALVLALNDAGLPIDKLFALYCTMADALYAFLSGTATHAPVATFSDLVERWKLKTFGTLYPTPGECRGLREIDVLPQRNVDKACERPFNIIGIAYAMMTSGVPMPQVEEIIFRLLDVKYEQYLRVSVDEDVFLERITYLTSTPNNELMSRVSVIASDSDDIKRAAKRIDRNLFILVQIRSTGHVQIFNLKKGPIRNLKHIAACLRMGVRIRTRRGWQYSLEELCAPGTLPDIPEVYNFVEQGHVFNGSKTAQGVPPIIRPGCLTERDVVECVRNGVRLLAKSVTVA